MHFYPYFHYYSTKIIEGMGPKLSASQPLMSSWLIETEKLTLDIKLYLLSNGTWNFTLVSISSLCKSQTKAWNEIFCYFMRSKQWRCDAKSYLYHFQNSNLNSSKQLLSHQINGSLLTNLSEPKNMIRFWVLFFCQWMLVWKRRHSESLGF